MTGGSEARGDERPREGGEGGDANPFRRVSRVLASRDDHASRVGDRVRAADARDVPGGELVALQLAV